MSSAPCTLPRRSADRKRTSRDADNNTAVASTTPWADSANDPRPSTTVRGPSPWSAACALASSSGDSPPTSRSVSPVSNARATAAYSPGRTASDAVAIELVDVRRGESSTIRAPSFSAA